MKYHIGFLGGGQLARMSIQAAQRMGLRCLSLDPGEVTPASQIAPSLIGALSDPRKIAQVFEQCERVTLENEFIPAQAVLDGLEISGREAACLVPGVETLATIQDKLLQREALDRAGVDCPSAKALDDGTTPDSYPAVLKSRFGGYDGKGTLYAFSEHEFEAHRPRWAEGGWMVEEFVPFRRELAVMVVVDGDTKIAFPTVETVQKNHVCDLVFPCDADGTDIAIAAVEAVGGKGLFGVELFEIENGQLLVNEIAPRPHNTGHYTLDWGGPSQFEAHVRVVMGLPPAQPVSTCFAVMANLLGREGDFNLASALQAALAEPGCFAHWYGKADMKPGRKMGHLNAVGKRGDVQEAIDRVLRAREAFFEVGLGLEG